MIKILFLGFFLLSACSPSSSSTRETAPGGPQKPGESGGGLQPDPSIWYVTNKACDGRGLTPAEGERVQFASGIIAYIEAAPAPSGQTCTQARIYDRVTQSMTSTPSLYTEYSALVSRTQLTKCRSQADQSITRNEPKDLSEPLQNLVLHLGVTSGTIDVSHALACPNGLLLLSLTKK